jgi:3-phenylpropionate/cinnamic acid dioxygenase small subunit
MSAHEQIRNAMATYARSIDDREFEGLRQVFDDDTEYVMTGQTVKGVDAAIEALKDRLADHPRHRHLISNIQIECDGDTASAFSYWHLVAPAGESAWEVVTAGTYADTLRCTGGRWVFGSRTISSAPR